MIADNRPFAKTPGDPTCWFSNDCFHVLDPNGLALPLAPAVMMNWISKTAASRLWQD